MNSQYGQNLYHEDSEKILRILLLVSLGCIIASNALGYDKCHCLIFNVQMIISNVQNYSGHPLSKR